MTSPREARRDRVQTKTRQTRIQRKNRETILEAALDVFAEGGFHGTTLDRIAEEAGLSKPNLLYYFASKEAIYSALLVTLLDTWLAPLRALDAAGDPLDEIVAYVRPSWTCRAPCRGKAGSSRAKCCMARRR